MNDTRKFFRQNRPQVSGSDKFMSELERQINLLPDISEQERLGRLIRKSGRLAVVSILSSILVSFILCLVLVTIVGSMNLIPDIFVYAVSAVVFAASVLIPLYRKEVL